ncbi:MAG: peptidoglycan-binding protein [Pseudomonadota bacterium]
MRVGVFAGLAAVAGLVAGLATPIWAQEPGRVALVIGNADYAHAPDALTARGDAIAVADALSSAEFEVDLGIDLDRAAIRARLETFARRAAGAEQAVVYFAGHAQRMGGVSHLAPVDARGDTPVAVAMDTVPLDLVMSVASAAQQGAVVFLDVAQLAGYTPRQFAEPGFADTRPPDGVLLVSAAPPGRAIRRSPDRDSRFARLVVDRFLEPDAPAFQVARDAGSEVWSVGGVGGDFVLYAPPPMSAREADLAREIELAVWQSAERSGAEEDYRAYLAQYPEGAFAALARNRLGQIVEAQRDPAEVAEAALGLKRAERRAIQRALRDIGQDPRGIDGVFGPATRRAIRRWQRAAGFAPTGYLTREQLVALRRAAEAAAEARARAEEAERRQALAREDAYWGQTGATGTVDGLRAYLTRYPEGRYAERAEAGLDRAADQARNEALKRERRVWRQIEQVDNAQGYRRYLATYPDGAFRTKAERRLRRIEAAERAEAERRRYLGIERSLDLSQADRAAVERRLGRLNYNPGKPDGVFNKRTRQAISGFQRDHGLRVTGFLDRRALVVLVRQSGGLRRAPTTGELVFRRFIEELDDD